MTRELDETPSERDESGVAESTARFGPLLVGLLASLLVSTPLAHTPWGPWISTAVYLLTLAGAAFAVGRSGRAGRVAVMLWFATLALEAAVALSGGAAGLPLAGRLVDAFFLTWVFGILIASLFRRERIGLEEVVGGVCGYLILGLIFTVLFETLEIMHAGSFLDGGVPMPSASGLGGESSRHPGLVYLSFATLTTVGFGDVVPATPIARSLAILESILGPLYLAILVASLVSMHLAERGRATPPRGPDR